MDSRNSWMARTEKVPVEVAATGLRVIGIGARHAERVMFTLGANTDRLAWGIAEARAARQKAGLEPDGVAFGTYINMACHYDMAAARNLVRGGLTTSLHCLRSCRHHCCTQLGQRTSSTITIPMCSAELASWETIPQITPCRSPTC